MHDSVVCSPLTSLAEEELVYNGLLHANSRFKENFSSYDFVSSNIALEALECGSTAYPVEEDCLGIVNSSVGEAVLDNCLQHEKSRLKKILLGYDFVGPNFQPGAQEGGTIAHSVKEDHQGIFVSSIEASFGQFDQSYLFDQKHPFDPFVSLPESFNQWALAYEVFPMVVPPIRPGFVCKWCKSNPCICDFLEPELDLFDQVHLVDSLDVIPDPFDQWKHRQEYQKRLPPFRNSHVLLLCFVSNILYAKWKKNVLCLVSRSSNWVALGRSPLGQYHRYFSASILFWFILFGLCTPALGVTCLSCFDGIEGCAGGAACLFATQTAANLAALTVAGGAAINVVSLLPSSYVRHLPTQVLRTLAAIARVPAADGPPDLGAMTLTELQECLASGRIETSAYCRVDLVRKGL